MSLSEELISKLREVLEKEEKIAFAVLFGSFAEGRDTFLSDIDLAIYLSQDMELLQLGRIVGELEKVTERRVDLLILNDALEKSPQIVYEVLSNGRLIFCRDRKSFMEFKVRGMLIYFDTAYLRDMVNEAFRERLEENLIHLEELRSKYSLDHVRKDRLLEWSLRYGLLEAIQIAIDIASYVVSSEGLGNPSTYRESIEILNRFGYIKDSVADKLSRLVGLRNLLVHEYISVDVGKLYGLLNELDLFRDFIRDISEIIKG